MFKASMSNSPDTETTSSHSEEWRDIEGFEGYYQISSWGRARSLTRNIAFSDGRRGRTLEGGLKAICPRRSQHHRVVYSCFNMSKEGIQKTGHVHLLVAKAFLPNPLGLPEINHIDGDGQNNRVENLEWVTSGQNQLHAYRTGLHKPKSGELHGKSKLTEVQVLDILSSLGSLSQSVVAKRYNVSRQTIHRIFHGKAWNHLPRSTPSTCPF